MKKLFYLLLFSPLVSFSQYVDMWHFSVPYNETNIYEASEKEWFAKVMSKAAKEGVIRGWGMSRRVGKEESNVSYITWISFGDINSRKEAYKSIGKYFNQTSKELYTPKLSEIGREKWGSYVVGNSNLYFDEFLSPPNGLKIKYSVHNLAMSDDPKNFSAQQKLVWLPFFKKLLKSKKTTQKSWGVARRINPRGKKHYWNVMTVDGYESLDDIFQSINSTIPGISKINLEPITKSATDGWYEQIIWENIIRVNSEGEIIE